MLTFLILSLVSSKTINVTIDSDQIVDRFEEYGQILEQSIHYYKDSQHPCYLVKQQLAQTSEISTNIIPSYSESSFQQYFDNGHYNGTIDEIVAATSIPGGSIVLTKQGILQHLLIDKQIILGSSLQLSIETNYRVFLKYLSKSQALLIVSNNQLTLFLLTNNTNVLENAQQIKLYESFKINTVQNVAVVNDMIFVALGKSGIHIFQYQDKNLRTIPFIISNTNITLQNIVDIKATTTPSKDVYSIYVLDNSIGVLHFTYNTITTLIQQNTKIGLIPFPGDLMDVNGDLLVIIQHKNTNSVVYEIKLTSNSFELHNIHNTFKDVQDIDILKRYIVIIGQSGHQVLRHSLPKNYSSVSKNHLILPNIQQLDYNDYRNKTIFFGYTKHRFFYSTLKEIPSNIKCHSTQVGQQAHFLYKQKSTQCPESEKNKFNQDVCEIEREYYVNFFVSQRGGGYSALILIYGSAAVLGLGFLLFVALLWKEYKKYEACVYNEMIDQPQHQLNETEMMQGSPDGKKFVRIPDKPSSLTPENFQE